MVGFDIFFPRGEFVFGEMQGGSFKRERGLRGEPVRLSFMVKIEVLSERTAEFVPSSNMGL